MIFYNHKIRQITSFTIGRKRITLGGDNEYLVLNSNYNLIKLRQDLENALSLLQGGRTFYRTGFYKNTLELSFQKIIKEAVPYGLIYQDESNISEFLTKYFIFIDSLSIQEQTRFNLFTSYMLDSCSQIILLENRIVNLYIALEIIDQSKTLNKDSLKNLLSIDSNDADLIVRIRNKLIHKGESLNMAIKASKKEIQDHVPNYRLPFKSNLARKLPGNFYFYLLTKTYEYIMDKIRVSNREVSYKQYC